MYDAKVQSRSSARAPGERTPVSHRDWNKKCSLTLHKVGNFFHTEKDATINNAFGEVIFVPRLGRRPTRRVRLRPGQPTAPAFRDTPNVDAPVYKMAATCDVSRTMDALESLAA